MGPQIYICPVLSCVLCYWNSLFGDFVHDDIPAILRNPDVLGYTNFTQMFFNDYWGNPICDNSSHKSYRPFTVITFRINYMLHGSWAPGFHVVNLSLHTVATCLLLQLCKLAVFKKDKACVLVSCLFAVHPIHTEAVSSIVGRAEILCAIFYLLSLKQFIYAIHSEKDGKFSLTISLLFASFALLCKEQGITVLPVLLVLIHFDKLVQKQRPNLSISTSYTTICLVAWMSILIGARLSIMEGMPTFQLEDNPASFQESVIFRMLNYGYIYVLNILLICNPANLCHDWSFGTIPVITSLYDPRNLCVCFGLIVAVLVSLQWYTTETKTHKWVLTLGLALLVFPFVPSSNWFFRVGFVIAERTLYLPSIGFCILIVYGINRISHITGRNINGSFYLLCIFLAFKTIQRNHDWENRETLTRSGLFVSPNNSKLHYNYANILCSKGNTNECILHYKEAIRLWPGYVSAHNNLAAVLLKYNATESRDHLFRALESNENHPNSLFNLAKHAWYAEKYNDVIKYLRRVITIDASCVWCYIFLAQAYEKTDQFGESIKNMKHAISIAIKKEGSLEMNLGSSQFSLTNVDGESFLSQTSILQWAEKAALFGNQRKAVHILKLAMEETRDQTLKTEYLFMLAECYRDIGELYNAIQTFLLTVENNPLHFEAHHNLAVAFHLQNNLTEARHHYETALSIDSQNRLLLNNYKKFQSLEHQSYNKLHIH